MKNISIKKSINKYILTETIYSLKNVYCNFIVY